MHGSNPLPPESAESAAFSHERWRDGFLRIVLIGGTILGFVAAAASAIDVIRAGNARLSYVYAGSWLVILVVTVHRWRYEVRAGTILILLYGLAVTGLFENGLRGDARLFFLAFTIMSVMLVNQRAGAAAVAGSIVTICIVGVLTLTGTVHLFSKVTPVGTPLQWLVSALVLVLLQTMVLLGLSMFLREFLHAQDEVRRGMGALIHERTLLRTVIDNIPDAVYAKDSSGRRQLSNTADARLMGIADAGTELGTAGAEVLPSESAEQLLAEDREVLRSGKSVINKEVAIKDLDGKNHWLLVSKLPLRGPSGEVVGIVGIDRDITEHKRSDEEREKLEEQLRLSQRMESVGRLAGGLAHDFNNLLTPILGYSDLLLADRLPGDSSIESLEQIKGAAERARDLARQLLAFGKGQELTLTPLDLRLVVRRFEKLLRRTVREDIEVALVLPSELGMVRADASAIEQVLLNLVLNSQEAMPKGGSITLTLRDATLAEPAAWGVAEAAQGRFVAVDVADSGLGMDAATVERVFDPFFTTKPHGTGLGLSTVYGIVRQHGGTIEVRSQPGAGTTFTVFVPHTTVAISLAGTGAERAQAVELRGVETILVVEDADAVRELVGRALERAGYKVHTASNGQQALQLAASSVFEIDLLLTDVVMPGMDGVELCQRMTAVRPELKVVYMSGYTRETILPHGLSEKGVALVTKPFLVEDLLRTVRMVLG